MSGPRLARTRRTSVRTRLLSIVAAALVPALVLVGVQATLARDAARHNAEENLLALAQVLANHQVTLINDTEVMMVGLAQLPEVADYLGPDCNKTLNAFWKSHPKYTGFGVLSPEGLLHCSAQPTASLLDFSHLTHFRRAMDTGQFAVGEFQIGAVSGLPTLAMGYPIRDDQGRIVAVLAAALGAAWSTEVLHAADLPVDGAAAVVDRHGIIMARVPEGEQYVGTQSPSNATIRAHLAQGDEVVTTKGVDGVTRVMAAVYLEVHGEPLGFVSVGATPKSIYGPVYDELTRNLLAVLAVGLVAGVAAWVAGDRIVGRPARRLEEASRRLQSGELAVRAGAVGGGAELERVASAIDGLAQTVQAQLDDLRRANDMKTDLINRISHELVTPLTPLRTQLAVLERIPADQMPPQVRSSLQVLHRNTDRLAAIVNSVLDASQVQAGSLSHEPTSLNLVALVQQSVRNMTGTNVAVQTPDFLAVHADPEQLRKVLLSILDNAARHSKGLPVHVRVAAVGKDALVEVRDEGTGLAPEQVDRLFQAFGQVHDTMQENRPGAGMSLFVAKAIVSRHGGRIWASSPGPKRGTTLSFTIPLASTADNPAR